MILGEKKQFEVKKVKVEDKHTVRLTASGPAREGGVSGASAQGPVGHRDPRLL